MESKNNLNVILVNIYLEDKIHTVKKWLQALKMSALIIQVTAIKRKTKQRKRASLVNDSVKNNNANGPPDKAKDIRAAKRARRRGKGLIDAPVEAEYKEKNEDGNYAI